MNRCCCMRSREREGEEEEAAGGRRRGGGTEGGERNVRTSVCVCERETEPCRAGDSEESARERRGRRRKGDVLSGRGLG